MSYITLLALLDTLGDEWLAQRAAPTAPAVDGVLLRLTVEGGDRSAYTAEDQAAADEAVASIQIQLDDANREIDSYLRKRHTLPLDQTLIDGSPLSRITADVVRYLISDDLVTDEASSRYSKALAWLRDVAAGRATLGEVDATPTTSGRVAVRTGISGTDWSTY